MKLPSRGRLSVISMLPPLSAKTAVTSITLVGVVTAPSSPSGGAPKFCRRMVPFAIAGSTSLPVRLSSVSQLKSEISACCSQKELASFAGGPSPAVR